MKCHLRHRQDSKANCLQLSNSSNKKGHSLTKRHCRPIIYQVAALFDYPTNQVVSTSTTKLNSLIRTPPTTEMPLRIQTITIATAYGITRLTQNRNVLIRTQVIQMVVMAMNRYCLDHAPVLTVALHHRSVTVHLLKRLSD